MLFDKSIGGKKIKSFKYMINRTLHRPREIISFCSECLKYHKNKSQLIGSLTVESAELIYSKDRLQDIAAEYRFEFLGIIELFETFRGKKSIFNDKELELHCLEIICDPSICLEASNWLNDSLEPKDLIKILWKVGFLKIFSNDSKQPNQTNEDLFVSYYQIPTINIPLVKYFQVHPMFWAYLKIIPS